MEQIKQIEKLHLEPGDIVVFHDFAGDLGQLIKECRATGHKYNNPILMLYGDQTVETMTPAEMKSKGWVRANGQE